MRAELQGIDPNDFLGWDEFTQYEAADPYDDFAWFTLTIGVDGQDGGSNFQIVVATPKAVSRVRARQRSFSGIVIDRFDPEAVECAIREHVSSVSGQSWHQIIDQLRETMLWEYEGMGDG